MPAETKRSSLDIAPEYLWGRRFAALLALALVFCLASSPVLAASKGNRYGAPLVFDSPPVDLEYDSGSKPKTPVAQPAPAPRRESAAPERVAPQSAAPVSGQAAAQPAQATAATPIHIFGTAAFLLNPKELPKWVRVRDSEIKMPTFTEKGLDVKNKQVAERWAKKKEELKDLSLMDKLKGVNTFFSSNTWPYKTDREVWGVEDYWATPREFIQRSGDCEDYAITKYYALRDLGVPASALRIVALEDTIRGIGHAVLVAFVGGDAYVLDNVTPMILSHSRLTHYLPKYSVNESGAWRQVRIRSGPGKR